MDQQIQKINVQPDFSRIYNDIIKLFPDKKNSCDHLLKKRNLSALEIIRLNKLIFGENDKESELFNRRHRCYKEIDIQCILEEKKRLALNNTQIAKRYNISRNTINKWNKISLNRV